jgi:spore maturation protein CgeB
MKILLVTETWDLSNGPYETLYPNIRKILEGMGHQVIVVDNKKNYLRIGGRTAWEIPPWLGRLRWLKFNDRIVNSLLLRTARRFQPDLILILKGENLHYDTIAQLRDQTRAILFNWSHDNPFWYSNTSIHLLRSMPLFDVFGSLSKLYIPVLETIGCQKAIFLPMFFNEERFKSSFYPVDNAGVLDSQIAFVGIGSIERANWLRQLLDYDLAIWGNWPNLKSSDPLFTKIRGSYLGGKDYALALQNTKISINVLNEQCKGAHNTRTFEATGLGAFLLTEYSPEQAEDLFVEDKEIVCFRSPDELLAKANYYLSHDWERRQIAAAGRARTLSEHTLFHRLQVIVKETEKLLSLRRPSSW